MANKMFWSYWVEGNEMNTVAELIGDVVGNDRVVANHNQLMTQLGTVIYMLSRRYTLTVDNTASTVVIEGSSFRLTLTEKWLIERARIE